jgi:apolipoprotein N-acyltransferase
MQIKSLSQDKNLLALQDKKFLAFIFGGVSALALAPCDFIIAALIGFSALFLITQEIKDKKEIFKTAWCFGFGHFLIGLYWISISLLVDVKFAWLIPFAVSLIPALAACYIGLTVLFTNLIATKLQLNKPRKILLLAIIWTFFEYLRSNFIFGGFPWNQIGYIFMPYLEISQMASIFGIYGMSILAIIICSLPALFIKVEDKKLSLIFKSENYLIIFFCLTALILSWVYGSYLLNKPNNYQKSVKLRLVQPAIEQKDKWDSHSRYDSFMENIILSKQPGLEEIDYLIWSESAIPYIIDKNNKILIEEITKAIPPNGFLITGGLRDELKDQDLKEIDKIWNSIFVMDNSGNIVNSYDKHRLVPFGEYIPFAQFLPFISKITDGAVGFSMGNGPQTIKVNDNLPSFSPLICYEVIYTDKIIDKNNPPEFFVNLTNDAWFGNSSGPYQHFAMARMRAIEYGIPVIRVANTGISALIDSHGRVIKQKKLGDKGIVDIKLDVGLNHTIYGQNGARYILILAYLILSLILL